MTSPFVFAKLSVPESALFWKLFHFAFGGGCLIFLNKGICLRISFRRLGLIVPGHEILVANLLVKSFIFYFLAHGAKVFGRALVSWSLYASVFIFFLCIRLPLIQPHNFTKYAITNHFNTLYKKVY